MGGLLISGIIGKLVGYFVNAWAWLFRTQGRLLRNLLVLAIIIVAAPPVTQYWMSRTIIPEVPVTAIIGMGMGTLFLVAFASSMYVLIGFIQQLTVSQRIMSFQVPKAQLQSMKPSDGTFIPTNDEKLYDDEMLEKLKRAGILNNTDVEGLASEIGHAQIIKMRGRTEQ